MSKIVKLEKDLKLSFVQKENEILGLKDLRDALGGDIEHITYNYNLISHGIEMWCLECGKLIEDWEHTISLVIVDEDSNEIIEEIAGPVIFTSMDKNGNVACLSPMQLLLVMSEIGPCKAQSQDGSETVELFALKRKVKS